jgi:hypothetical protein
MADDEDIAALVVDNGSGMCKGKHTSNDNITSVNDPPTMPADGIFNVYSPWKNRRLANNIHQKDAICIAATATLSKWRLALDDRGSLTTKQHPRVTRHDGVTTATFTATDAG